MTISGDDWARSTGTIWRFQVFDGLRLLDETFVPRHQMGETAAYEFRRSCVVNAMDLPIDEALAHFVNRRQGRLKQVTFWPSGRSAIQKSVNKVFG